MPENIEKSLELIIEGQRRGFENDKQVLNEVENLKKAFERLHQRFDEIHEKSIIHSQKIDVLEKGLCKAETICHEQRELIWSKMRQYKVDAIQTATKNIKLWVYGSLLAGLAGLLISIFKSFVKIP